MKSLLYLLDNLSQKKHIEEDFSFNCVNTSKNILLVTDDKTDQFCYYTGYRKFQSRELCSLLLESCELASGLTQIMI